MKFRKTGRQCYLIPELCKPTGLEENIRSNFVIMKEVSAQTKPDPNRRLQKTQEIIRKINECKVICTKEQDEEEAQRKKNKEEGEIVLEKTQEQKETEAWMKKKIDFLRGVQINNEPESFNSRQIQIQEYANDKTIIRAGGKYNWERDMQIPIKQMSKIKRIALVYTNKEICQIFQTTFAEAVKDFNFQCEPLRTFEVKGHSLKTWMETMNILKVQFCEIAILILPGPKKAAPLYADLKRFLTQEAGIPSQIVLEATIKGKGIRSICNKIVVQMCAKVGGVPYIIRNLPFIDLPTVIVGIDVYHKTCGGVRKSVFAFVATVDNSFTRYFSIVKVQESGQEIGSYVEDCCANALENFFSYNKSRYPSRIIVFRDGVSESQRVAVKTLEVEAIRRACTAKNIAVDLIFLCLDKKTNAKFYELTKPPNVQNCSPGTIIDDPTICSYEEFFLISQKVTQGIAEPTHYFSLVDDIAAKCQNEYDKMQHKNKLEVLAYKLCYLYFNWVGSIKVPAPCNYAHKLSNLVGDKWPSSNFVPHKHLAEIHSLYFI